MKLALWRQSNAQSSYGGSSWHSDDDCWCWDPAHHSTGVGTEKRRADHAL